MIEIAGRDREGAASTRRWMVTDPNGNVAFGAKGLALAAERLLGLDDRPPPGGGVYFLEVLLDAEWVLGELPELGLMVVEVV